MPTYTKHDELVLEQFVQHAEHVLFSRTWAYPPRDPYFLRIFPVKTAYILSLLAYVAHIQTFFPSI